MKVWRHFAELGFVTRFRNSRILNPIFPFSKSYPEIESTWSTAKCMRRKYFHTWYYIVTLCNAFCKGKDKLWNFSFRAFHKIQFQGHFIKHELLSRNIFALVSKLQCVCFSSITKIMFTEKDIFWQWKINSIKFW